jgi:hypothetical protein
MLHGFRLPGTSVFFATLLVLAACGPSGHRPEGSFLHRMMDTLEVSKKGNALVYSINPNDCISCLNGFKIFDRELSGKASATIYVISIARQVEKEEWKKKIAYPDLRPEKNKAVFWGKEICDSLGKMTNINLPLTTLIVYNYTSDSVLFARPVREITDLDELEGM